MKKKTSGTFACPSDYCSTNDVIKASLLRLTEHLWLFRGAEDFYHPLTLLGPRNSRHVLMHRCEYLSVGACVCSLSPQTHSLLAHSSAIIVIAVIACWPGVLWGLMAVLRSALMIVNTVRPTCLVGLQMRLNSQPSLKPSCRGLGEPGVGARRGVECALFVGPSGCVEFIVVGHNPADTEILSASLSRKMLLC